MQNMHIRDFYPCSYRRRYISAWLILCLGVVLVLSAVIWEPQPAWAASAKLSVHASDSYDKEQTPPRLPDMEQPVGSSVVDEGSTTLFFPLLITHQLSYFPIIAIPDLVLIEPSPRHEEAALSPNANLVWTAQKPDNVDVVSYRVYLEANDETPDTLVASTSDTHLDPPTFETNTQYYWQVVADDSTGRQIPGSVWSFMTEGPFSPEKLGSMVHVPAGEFLMGCDRNVPAVYHCLDRETPLHAVYLDAYDIDKYEVTNREYQACVEAGVCDPPRREVSRLHDFYYGNPDFDLFPVIYVSWQNAQDYCGWKGKRLPTEAEWEKAARGTIDTRTWPWGEEAPDCSRQNFTIPPSKAFCAGGDTNRVGSYPAGASSYGAMDLSGNVFEWVADKYEVWYYRMSPYMNPTGPDWKRQEYVIRGGSFQDNWWYTRVVHRHYGHHGDKPFTDSPHYRNRKVGFRCARSALDE